MASPDTLIDGNWLKAEPVDAPRTRYFFRTNGDRVAVGFDQDFWQTRATYTPKEFTVPHETLRDHYLVAETDPVEMMAGLIKFTRTYVRIPADQVTYGSRPITKPLFPTQDYNSAWVDTLASDAEATIWREAAAATFSYYVTGGTLTITYKTSTTGALAHNASGATIKAAVEALADVISDGFTVTVTNNIPTTGSLVFTPATGSFPGSVEFSANFGSITPVAISARITAISSTVEWRVERASIAVNSVQHLLSVGNPVRLITSTTGGGTLTTVDSVPDVDNFTCVNPAATSGGFAYIRRRLRSYTPGADRASIRLTQKFFLPGVTPNIATPTDIPTPDVLLNDGIFLTAISENIVGYQTYDATELVRWFDWPIYTYTLIELNFDNV